jgi:nicotinate-nucleotide adenylyltransferase
MISPPRHGPQAALLDFARLPPYGRGQTIGLLGGSFNPPHDGHRLISELALRRLGLDRVWWLASPGNPLKSHAELAALRSRLEAAKALSHNPRISVSGLEAEIGSRFTCDTLRWLKRRAPGARFVWIMGADNLIQFHRWRNWREIADLVPILVVDRPGSTLRAMSSRAAQALARWRRAERDGCLLAYLPPPALMFLHGPRSDLSSTSLRLLGRVAYPPPERNRPSSSDP